MAVEFYVDLKAEIDCGRLVELTKRRLVEVLNLTCEPEICVIERDTKESGRRTTLTTHQRFIWSIHPNAEIDITVGSIPEGNIAMFACLDCARLRTSESATFALVISAILAEINGTTIEAGRIGANIHPDHAISLLRLNRGSTGSFETQATKAWHQVKP